MNLNIFEDMPAQQLRGYIEFLLWHYRVMDSFWYLNIAEQFDEPTADRLNERVWDRIAAMAAKDLVKRFEIGDRGLKGFVQALRYGPWCILVGYHIVERPEEVVISVVARLARKAAEARKKLARFGIDIDAADNGVALPRSLHQRLHTEQYYDLINSYARTWKNRAEALEGLRQIRMAILRGSG